jgi:hypothetical protein
MCNFPEAKMPYCRVTRKACYTFCPVPPWWDFVSRGGLMGGDGRFRRALEVGLSQSVVVGVVSE